MLGREIGIDDSAIGRNFQRFVEILEGLLELSPIAKSFTSHRQNHRVFRRKFNGLVKVDQGAVE